MRGGSSSGFFSLRSSQRNGEKKKKRKCCKSGTSTNVVATTTQSQEPTACVKASMFESHVCTICYSRSLKKMKSVQLECKHQLCSVCYSKVFCCPFCRSPFYGSVGKSLKRATKMYFCLMKQFKKKESCKASSVLLLMKLLQKAKDDSLQLDKSAEGVKQITSRIHTLFGTVRFKLLGEFNLAAAEYKAALELFPENVAALNLYSAVLSRQGCAKNPEPLQQAVALMERALKLDPDNPVLFCNLSKYYAQLGQYDISFKLLDQAKEMNSSKETVLAYINCNRRRLRAYIDNFEKGGKCHFDKGEKCSTVQTT